MMNVDNEAIAKELGGAGGKATKKNNPNHFSKAGKASAKARKRKKEAVGISMHQAGQNLITFAKIFGLQGLQKEAHGQD